MSESTNYINKRNEIKITESLLESPLDQFFDINKNDVIEFIAKEIMLGLKILQIIFQ